jgi:hypothetical protein
VLNLYGVPSCSKLSEKLFCVKVQNKLMTETKK